MLRYFIRIHSLKNLTVLSFVLNFQPPGFSLTLDMIFILFHLFLFISFGKGMFLFLKIRYFMYVFMYTERLKKKNTLRTLKGKT